MFRSATRENGSPAAQWVATEILPHERDVRRWLAGSSFALDIDDVIQEAYCAIAGLGSVAHIRSGRAYLFTTVRNIALEHLRRAKIVPMDALAELTPAIEIDDRPTTEAIVWSRLELDRLIEGLPPRCQSVFRLCYVKGMTQKEAARELRVSENVVQKQLTRAMAQVVKGYARGSEPERTGADG
jgi:RNA polymerase sigma factor (sigma-70 family)